MRNLHRLLDHRLGGDRRMKSSLLRLDHHRQIHRHHLEGNRPTKSSLRLLDLHCRITRDRMDINHIQCVRQGVMGVASTLPLDRNRDDRYRTAHMHHGNMQHCVKISLPVIKHLPLPKLLMMTTWDGYRTAPNRPPILRPHHTNFQVSIRLGSSLHSLVSMKMKRPSLRSQNAGGSDEGLKIMSNESFAAMINDS